MKQTTMYPSSCPIRRAGIKPAPTFIIILTLASLFLAPITFAATKHKIHTPYNALARRLPSNTTKGVYSETDPLQPNTQISGTVWGKNGSTFIIRLPKDDAGYNVLFLKDTVITLNGKKATSKNILKGVAVTVQGTLDTATYTIKATRVDLGKSVPASEKPVDVPSKKAVDTLPNK